jgi:alkylation response protein AidB-like acyl-CoA dehydrogenase
LRIVKGQAFDQSALPAGRDSPTFGGFAFAREYDIDRKWREVRLYQTAPISTNLILAYLGHHVLGMGGNG